MLTWPDRDEVWSDVNLHVHTTQVLRGMISELPARATTKAEIDRVKSHMERIEMEGKKYAAIMDVSC